MKRGGTGKGTADWATGFRLPGRSSKFQPSLHLSCCLGLSPMFLASFLGMFVRKPFVGVSSGITLRLTLRLMKKSIKFPLPNKPPIKRRPSFLVFFHPRMSVTIQVYPIKRKRRLENCLERPGLTVGLKGVSRFNNGFLMSPEFKTPSALLALFFPVLSVLHGC